MTPIINRARLVALATALVAAVVIPTTAQASTVYMNGGSLVVAGLPGEANQVYMTLSDGKITIADQATDISESAPNCAKKTLHMVACSTEPVVGVGVHLGDRNDVATADLKWNRGIALYGNEGDDTLKVIGNAAGLSYLRGDEGDDTINGRDSGPDDIAGGIGNDVLYGGGGADVLKGEADQDRLIGNAGPDKLYGGPGIDSLLARDWEKDKVIDCGSGPYEIAKIDPFEKQLMTGCEYYYTD